MTNQNQNTNVNSIEEVTVNQATPITNPGMQGLLDFLTNGVVLAELEAGHHKARLVKAEFVGATEDSKEYVQMEYILTDDENRVVYERRYGKGMQIFTEQLHAQLGKRKQRVTVPMLLKYAMTHEFDVWITYTDASNGSGVRYTNISLREPAEAISTSITPAVSGMNQSL